MSIKLRLKVGDVELDYEGDEALIKTELQAILANVISVVSTASNGGRGEDYGVASNDTSGPAQAQGGSPGFQRTVTNILVKLGSKEQQDLVVAAAAYLTLVEGKGEFLRKDLLDAMKSATGYFKTNHSKNLSYLLDGLMKAGKINNLGKDRYSVDSEFLAEIKRTLGIS